MAYAPRRACYRSVSATQKESPLSDSNNDTGFLDLSSCNGYGPRAKRVILWLPRSGNELTCINYIQKLAGEQEGATVAGNARAQLIMGKDMARMRENVVQDASLRRNVET